MRVRRSRFPRTTRPEVSNPLTRKNVRAKALLFDLDGVLVDSSECVRRICTDWAIARGLDPEFVFRMGQGRRVQDTIRAIASHLDVDAEVATLVGMEARSTDGLSPVAGADALLGKLPSDAWAVVTSGARAVATLRLRHVGLPLPQTLITGDDVERGKPDPEGYLAAARALGRDPSECIVIEDAPAGIDAARAAGMRSIGVAGTFPAAELVNATVVVPSLASIRVWVEGRGLRVGA
jgi:mannitol-1-/sugar-/sorbitol-6-phosphatase